MAITLAELTSFPVTVFTAGLCLVTYFYLYNYRVNLRRVSLSYADVIEKKEVWRLVTSTFAHVNIFHLFMNLSTFWNYRFLEPSVGSWTYATVIILLYHLSALIFLGIKHVTIFHLRRENARNNSVVGFSAVLFGLMAYSTIKIQSTGNVFLFGFLKLPSFAAPFVALLVTQLILPKASFEGHFSGIIAGYIIALVDLGFGLGLSPYWRVNFAALYVDSLFMPSLKIILILRQSNHASADDERYAHQAQMASITDPGHYSSPETTDNNV